MPLVPAKCTQCGSNLEIDNTKEAAICPICNTPFVTEKAIHNYNTTNVTEIENLHADVVNVVVDDERENLLKSAETYIKFGDYSKAKEIYEKMTENAAHEFRVWWGLIRSETKDLTDYDINSWILDHVKWLYSRLEKILPSEECGQINKRYNDYVTKCEQEAIRKKENFERNLTECNNQLAEVEKNEESALNALEAEKREAMAELERKRHIVLEQKKRIEESDSIWKGVSVTIIVLVMVMMTISGGIEAGFFGALGGFLLAWGMCYVGGHVLDCIYDRIMRLKREKCQCEEGDVIEHIRSKEKEFENRFNYIKEKYSNLRNENEEKLQIITRDYEKAGYNANKKLEECPRGRIVIVEQGDGKEWLE